MRGLGTISPSLGGSILPVGNEAWGLGRGNTPWNKKDQTKPKPCKKCGIVKEPEAYYIWDLTGGRRTTCKECDKKARVRRGFKRKKPEITAYYEVKYDPTEIYDRNVRFPYWDFEESILGNIWPVGMIVERMPGNHLMIVETCLMPIEQAYANQEEG